MCMAIFDPSHREAAKYWGDSYRPDDETDRRLTENYNSRFYGTIGDPVLNKSLEGEKSKARHEIVAYRKERAENEKAPRPTSAQTTDENIETKVKKKKEALGAMVKAKDRDTILSSMIKGDRNTLG